MIDNNGLILFNLGEKSKNDKKKASLKKVGIPQYLTCFKSGRLWKNFFDKLGLTCVVSKDFSLISNQSKTIAKSYLHGDKNIESFVLASEILELSSECDFILLGDCANEHFEKVFEIFKDSGTKILVIKKDDLPLVDKIEMKFISDVTLKSNAQMTAALTLATRLSYKEGLKKKCVYLCGNPLIVCDGAFNKKVIEVIRKAGFDETFEEDTNTIAEINFINKGSERENCSPSFLPTVDIYYSNDGIDNVSVEKLCEFLSSLVNFKQE